MQAALAEALSSHATPEVGAVRAWIFGILRHKIADHFRAGKKRGEASPLDNLQAPPAPHDAQDLLRWAERELPRNADGTLEWLLREGDGESLGDIADEAAVGAPAVRQRVSRLRRHFRARWALEAAALAALLVLAFFVFRALRKDPETVRLPPPIERTPEERAARLREEARELCTEERCEFRRCLELLDQAKELHPAGDPSTDSLRARAVRARDRANTPSPAPSATSTATRLLPKPDPSGLPSQPTATPKLPAPRGGTSDLSF